MLGPGTKLGPYEIVGAIGAGGMGEVYRARDTKLSREVALKVLPEAFARDAERMARFEREAKVLASLNHPNIASIYGLEESNGVRAFVMELVEGSTLAETIAKGPIPIDEALSLAKQICEGMEYAHERGIIHRDLKPANIKITAEGAVKLLDFGLAKALEGEATTADPSTSPTLSHLATQAGIILGTAAYMAPEQAKAKSVDRRADIWAFGCVLYEMLAGNSAFSGETVTDVLAAVVRAEPDWSLLPVESPATIRILLHKCLIKDARQRLRDIGDARVALEETLSRAAMPEESPAVPARSSPRNIVTGAVGLLLGMLLGGVGVWAWLSLRAPTAPTIVSQIAPPTGESFAFSGIESGPPVISPDGKQLAFVGVGSDGRHLIWVRPLNVAAAQPLAGTDGATYPFWSPDARYIGFFAGGKLNRIGASGGPPLAIADAPNGRGGTWSQEGSILFTPDISSPLYRVPASGGTPQPATKLETSRQESSHRWPEFLPDGKHFLFYVQNGPVLEGSTYAASLDGDTPKLLVRGDSSAVYAPPGYLLFVRQGTLMAQRLDDGLRAIGDAVPLIEHVAANFATQRAILTVSQNGILAYEAGSASTQAGRLFWFDRSGKQIEETVVPNAYGTLRLSPDGRKLAVTGQTPGTTGLNIWVYDLVRGAPTRLTFSANTDAEPSWSPDGTTIAFMSNRSGQPHLYQKAADGTGSTLPLVVDDAKEYQPSFSLDGRYLIFLRLAAPVGSHGEIWALPLTGDRKPFPVVQNPQFDVSDPMLSPDGKWLAYMSPESQRPELYVVPFGHGRGRWQVSTGGGRLPLWSRDGKELFYLSMDNKIVSAQISEQGTSLTIGKVAPLLQVSPVPVNGWSYDVSADGKKFIVNTQGSQRTAEPLTLVVNWTALLKKQ